jgi:serine/threonine-protein kinase
MVAQSLETKERREVLAGGSDARYLPVGLITYALADNLFAVPFDVNTLKVTGGPVPIAQGVLRAAGGNTATANYGVSVSGSLVYVADTGGRFGRLTLVWVDRQGKEEGLNVPERSYFYARLSPDGTRIALDIRDQDNDIWTWDIARQSLARLTFDPGLNRSPEWSPDGKRIAFSARRDNSENIYWQAADGSGMPEPLTKIPNGSFLPNGFSTDGTQLLLVQANEGNLPVDISRVKVGGDGKPEPVLQTSFNEEGAQISPDGHWMAYDSDESGRTEVYVRPYPDVNKGRWQVSTGGGSKPLWNPNGRELFYYLEPGTLMSAPVESGTMFKAGTPQVIFQGQYFKGGSGRQYSVSPDGRRFLMIKNVASTNADAPLPQIVIVQNWFEELKRRVPAGRK